MPGKKRCLEEIEFLARSLNRVELLEILSENGSLRKRELRQHCSGVRTTVQRNVDALEERGWIRNTNGEYEITPSGNMVVESLSGLMDVVDTARELEAFLEWIPSDAHDIEYQLFAGADVLLPEPGDPYALLNRHLERVKTMNQIHGFLRVTGLHAHEAAHEAIVDSGGACEVVLTENVAYTWLSKPQYAELTEDMLATDRLTLHVSEDNFPFSLAIIDDTVQIMVDDDDVPVALLETDSPAVRDWANQTYTQYRQQATPHS